MSRIGEAPVFLPDGVSLNVDGVIVSAKGKLGEMSVNVTDHVRVSQADNVVRVAVANDSREAQQMWGTARALISNIVIGVSEGFTRKLEVNGTGYRAQVQGNKLILNLGFSHDINFPIPDGIKIVCPDQTHIEVSGIDKQQVGQVAAEIRRWRPPEPYKGKGVRYENEFIIRKEGKKK